MTKRRSTSSLLFMVAVLSALIFSVVAGTSRVADAADNVKCKLQFTLSGWSIFYETAHGRGTITCDNGQSAAVKITAKGGGLTAGKFKRHGKGVFSEVSGISRLYGAYAKAEAHAGVVKSATAQVVTKGEVSLALSGTGEGFDLGVGFGKFRIDPAGRK